MCFDDFYPGGMLEFMKCCFCTCCYRIIFPLCFVDMGSNDSFSNANLNLTAWKILDIQCVNPRLLGSIYYFFSGFSTYSFSHFAIVSSEFGISELLIFRINWNCSLLLSFWNSVELYICSLAAGRVLHSNGYARDQIIHVHFGFRKFFILIYFLIYVLF